MNVIYILRNNSYLLGTYLVEEDKEETIYPNESIILENPPLSYSPNVNMVIQQKIINTDKILNELPKKYTN